MTSDARTMRVVGRRQADGLPVWLDERQRVGALLCDNLANLAAEQGVAVAALPSALVGAVALAVIAHVREAGDPSGADA